MPCLPPCFPMCIRWTRIDWSEWNREREKWRREREKEGESKRGWEGGRWKKGRKSEQRTEAKNSYQNLLAPFLVPNLWRLLLSPQILLGKLLVGLREVCVSQASAPSASSDPPSCCLPRNAPNSLLSHNPNFSWILWVGTLDSFHKNKSDNPPQNFFI